MVGRGGSSNSLCRGDSVWFGLHVPVPLLVSSAIRSYLHFSLYIIYMYISKDRFLADGNSKHVKNCRNIMIDDDILRPTIFRLYIYAIIHLCWCSKLWFAIYTGHYVCDSLRFPKVRSRQILRNTNDQVETVGQKFLLHRGWLGFLV